MKKILAVILTLTLPVALVLPLLTTPALAGGEVIKLRDQYSRTCIDEDGYGIKTSYLGSIHYEDDYGNFQPIDTTIVHSDKSNWDWEVTDGHWQLFIKNDTTAAIKKDSNWVGTRLHGIAYLDITTKDYTILQTTNSVTPVVSGSEIRWENILYGVDYVIRYTNDSFKEDIIVKQEARDLLASPGHRPSDYGYDTQNTFLVPIFEMDWSQSLPMKLRSGTTVNPDEAEHEEVIYFEASTKDKYFDTRLVSFFPLDYAVSVNPINPEDLEEEWEYANEKIRKRLIVKNDKHWLLIGVSVAALNQMPQGAIIFDPTLTLRPTGIGTIQKFDSLTGAPTHWQAVDEVAADDDTTKVYTGGAGFLYQDTETFQLADHTAEAGLISNITVYIRYRANGPDSHTGTPVIYTHSTQYNGTARTNTTSWASHSHTWTTNPDTLVAWTWAEVDALEAGAYVRAQDNEGGATASLSQVYVVITYELPTIPSLTTDTPVGVTTTTATFDGDITSDGGGGDATTRGFKYGLTEVDTWDESEAGSFGTGSYSLPVTGLSVGTTYYVRAYATNAEGTGYGEYVEFTTIGLPSTTTNAATYIAYTTARLNSILTDDGGEASDVRFQYNTSENWTSCDNTSWVEDYTTGQHPYADINSLLHNTLYYFRVQAKNSAGTANGTALTFTTENEVVKPTNFKAFPGATQVVLTWTKGAGSTSTHIRYKVGTYPTSKTDGTQVYLGTLGSYTHTGLTSGITHNYSAWGASGDNYSDDYAMVMATTLPTAAEDEAPSAPGFPLSWFQIPDHAKFSAVPFYGVINTFLEAFEMPLDSGWFLFAMLGCVAFGLIILGVSKSLMAALIALAFVMAAVSLAELLPMFMIAFSIMFMIGASQLKGAR